MIKSRNSATRWRRSEGKPPVKHALVLFATYVVFGASAAEATDPRATRLTYEPWTKVCFGGLNCLVAAGARGACYPSGGGLSIDFPNEKHARLSANLGTKHPVENTISIQIDQGDPILIPDPKCYAFGCGGKVAIDSSFVERLKHAQTILIEATDAAHQRLSLSLPLAGFAKAYDGPGSEPKVFEELQERLEELLRQQAEKPPPPQCED